jgi:SAM-dependent methyltransferase
MSDAPWWQRFYDRAYVQLWGEFYDAAASQAQADAIWTVLGLAAGRRVLDAPCGFGRLSRPLAARGAQVVGVDQSADLLAEAERTRGELGADALAYVHHDLRQPLDAGLGTFDAAIDVFSSIGHGSEDDDRAVFATFARVLAPGGQLLVETMHRDVIIARRARGEVMTERRLSDGTVLREDARWDPLRGRVDSTWRWHGPAGDGEKRSSLRLYALPELVALLAGAGFDVTAAYRGCTTEPFTGDGPTAGGRVALVARRR